MNHEKSHGAGAELHRLFLAVFALHSSLSRHMDEAHARAGLSTPKARILRELAEQGSMTVPRLAERLNLSRQFVLKTCNDLCEHEFVDIKDNPHHKKSKLIAISPAGEAARTLFRQRENALLEQILPGMDREQVRSATEVLAHLNTLISSVDELP